MNAIAGRKFGEPSADQSSEKLSDVLTSERVKIAEIFQNYRTDSALYLTGSANCEILPVLRPVGQRIRPILPAVTIPGVTHLANLWKKCQKTLFVFRKEYLYLVVTSTKHLCFFLTIPLALWVLSGCDYQV